MKVYKGNCLEVLTKLQENSVDTCITDPPYGLKFMGKKWDYDVPSVEIWREVFRVLKPGAFLLSFGGTRTWHRIAVNIEDAGFEIRDTIMWLYGQGFPKSFDISKGIDKRLGVEREVIATTATKVGVFAHAGDGREQNINDYENKITVATSDEAKLWEGYGTALKPAHEPIIVAMKPAKSFVDSALDYGVAGLNIDGSRIPTDEVIPINKLENWSGFGEEVKPDYVATENTKGRFPSNVIIDDEAGEMLEEKARFFYCAKVSKKERDEGMSGEEKSKVTFQTANGTSGKPSSISEGRDTKYKNTHPTVKPIELMKYLCTLTKTPTGGIVLDPFMGSGSTGIGCIYTGRDFIGIESEQEYFKIAIERLKYHKGKADEPTD